MKAVTIGPLPDVLDLPGILNATIDFITINGTAIALFWDDRQREKGIDYACRTLGAPPSQQPVLRAAMAYAYNRTFSRRAHLALEALYADIKDEAHKGLRLYELGQIGATKQVTLKNGTITSVTAPASLKLF